MHLAVGSFERGVMLQLGFVVQTTLSDELEFVKSIPFFRFGFVRVQRVQNTGDGINDELRIYIYTGETVGSFERGVMIVKSSGSEVRWQRVRIRWHGFYLRRAVHLTVGSFERGVMIQFCGIVRV